MFGRLRAAQRALLREREVAVLERLERERQLRMDAAAGRSSSAA
jgi:hypothetical protein